MSNETKQVEAPDLERIWHATDKQLKRRYIEKYFAPCFVEAAMKADANLVAAAVTRHRTPANTKISCYIKHKKFRDSRKH